MSRRAFFLGLGLGLIALLATACGEGLVGEVTDEEVAAEEQLAAELDAEDGMQPFANGCTTGSVYTASVRSIIRKTFGSYGCQALRVAQCESGPWGTRAANGQYRGLFQMGSHERATYGHSSCAETQARAAFRYFNATSHTWSPWECKPSWRSTAICNK